MKVTIHLTRGYVEILSMSGDGVLELLDEWERGDSPVLRLSLDEESTTYIARAHIVRIDVDPTDGEGA